MRSTSAPINSAEAPRLVRSTNRISLIPGERAGHRKRPARSNRPRSSKTSIEREKGGSRMSTPFMSELRIMSFNFAPKGWAECNGQFLPINQNQALFSLLGTMYGGNGQTMFALPDLRGKVPIHVGNGFTQGQAGGQESHTLTQS